MTAPVGDTFEAVAREWIKAQSATWSPAHSARILSRFERDVFKAIGSTAVAEVAAPQILAMLRPVEDRARGHLAKIDEDFTAAAIEVSNRPRLFRLSSVVYRGGTRLQILAEITAGYISFLLDNSFVPIAVPGFPLRSRLVPRLPSSALPALWRAACDGFARLRWSCG